MPVLRRQIVPTLELAYKTEFPYAPVSRNRPQPRQAGGNSGHRRHQALRHHLPDSGTPSLVHQVDYVLLLCDQRVDPRRLPVEEGGDRSLLGQLSRNGRPKVLDVGIRDSLLPAGSIHRSFAEAAKWMGHRKVEEEPGIDLPTRADDV
jgi:hypothetical protein